MSQTQHQADADRETRLDRILPRRLLVKLSKQSNPIRIPAKPTVTTLDGGCTLYALRWIDVEAPRPTPPRPTNRMRVAA